jgi:hypothetical protein
MQTRSHTPPRLCLARAGDIPPAKPRLRLARLDVEQACQFLMEHDGRTPGPTPCTCSADWQQPSHSST